MENPEKPKKSSDEPKETESSGKANKIDLRTYLLLLLTLVAGLLSRGEWEDSGRNGTLYDRRTPGFRSLNTALGPTAVNVQGAPDSHGNKHANASPPPWSSMAHTHHFRQQQSLDQGIRGFPRDGDYFIKTERAIAEGTKMIEEGTKMIEEGNKMIEEAKARGGRTIDEEHRHQSRKLKLCFQGSLKPRIYTNKPLQVQSNGGIEIAICRDDEIITSGHLASLKIEIVALESDHSCKGEWTEDDFDRQIRKSRDGQGSVLDGERLVKLVNGRASLGNIRFKEGSTGTRTREFVLAARVCKSENIGGLRVEEAFLHPSFMVLVERSKANEKSCLPKLHDKIHDLRGIAKNGPYAKRLEKENIFTVEDFLKALNKDPDELRQIMGMKSESFWEALVRHARECDLKDRHGLKSYRIETDNIALFFNSVDDLVGAEFHGRFVAKDKFDAAQKVLVDRQLKQAYRRLDGIEFCHVMEGNHPVRISTNINAAGSTSIPTLLFGASPQNTPGHQGTFQAENLNPSGCWTDCAPSLPLGNANCNAAGQTVSEPSHPERRNGHENQGEACWWLDTSSAADIMDMDDIHRLIEELGQTTTNVPDCSHGGNAFTPGSETS